MQEENGGSKREPSSLCPGAMGNSARVLVFPGELGSVPLADRYFYVALLLTHLLYKRETQLSFPLGRQELNCVEEGDAELKGVLQQRKSGKNYRQDDE